jgi:hypothetical protein
MLDSVGATLAVGNVVIVNGKDMQSNLTGGQILGVITNINVSAITIQLPTERGFKGDAPTQIITYVTAACWTIQPSLVSGPGGD